jgi:hypothetical protein
MDRLGSKFSPTKLDEISAYLIRFLLRIGCKGKFVADWMNLHPSTVSRIKSMKYWKFDPSLALKGEYKRIKKEYRLKCTKYY